MAISDDIIEVVSVSEAASSLGISERTVYLWSEHGKLEGIKLARNILRITVRSINELILSNKKVYDADGEA
jgi:excisionase family DNA binding protein